MSRFALVATISLSALLGCDEPSRSEAVAPDRARPSEPQFDLRLEADARYPIGEEATFGVSVRPRGAMHVETRYPWRITLHECDGVALARTELANRDATRLDASEARFDVRFVPEQAGSHRCVLDLDFAVCADSGCFPIERRVSVELSAS